MNKVILGTVAGIAAGYFFRKIQERVDLRKMRKDINGLSDKTKKKLKDLSDKSFEQANSIKDQINN